MSKKKSKQASAAKVLSSTLMQMANWLRYKEGWLPDAATRQAWLCQHALERLGEGVVQLQYVKLMQSTDTMKPELMLMYFICVKEVYHYLYKARQFNREGYDAAEPYKHINDVFTTILKEHDAD